MLQNNKHVKAIVTYVWLIPLVYALPGFIARFLPDNQLLVVVVSLAFIVPLMMYVIVPVSLIFLSKLMCGANADPN
ncbi:MAG: hypothetical protein OXE99_09690 [Cellvibrionales bacterium]|nr:hypothetical protein [Cellvibrionales bacterium]